MECDQGIKGHTILKSLKYLYIHSLTHPLHCDPNVCYAFFGPSQLGALSFDALYPISSMSFFCLCANSSAVSMPYSTDSLISLNNTKTVQRWIVLNSKASEAHRNNSNQYKIHCRQHDILKQFEMYSNKCGGLFKTYSTGRLIFKSLVIDVTWKTSSGYMQMSKRFQSLTTYTQTALASRIIESCFQTGNYMCLPKQSPWF